MSQGNRLGRFGAALIGAALAIIVLVPLGWLLGRRMARPIAQTADCIAQIGRTDPAQLQLLLPQLQVKLEDSQ